MNMNHTATVHYVIKYYLTVRTDPIGVVTILGEGWYNKSTYVILEAPTVYEYSFEYWSIDGILQGTEINPIAIHMNAPHTAIAHYVKITNYTLTIIAGDGGTADPPPGNYTYTINATVQVRAIPYSDYIFDHWELDNVGSTNPYSLLMDKNHVLKAVFSPAAAGWFVPDWFWWLLLLLVLIFLLLLIWLYLRRRRKKTEEAFRSGWTAWYYCYDLRKNRRM